MASRSVLWRTLSRPSLARSGCTDSILTSDYPRSSGYIHRRRDGTLSSPFAAYVASCSSSEQQTAGRSDQWRWLGLASQCSRQLPIGSSISCRTNDIRQCRSGPISWSGWRAGPQWYQALASIRKGSWWQRARVRSVSAWRAPDWPTSNPTRHLGEEAKADPWTALARCQGPDTVRWSMRRSCIRTGCVELNSPAVIGPM
jgi:hypothetical protein